MTDTHTMIIYGRIVQITIYFDAGEYAEATIELTPYLRQLYYSGYITIRGAARNFISRHGIVFGDSAESRVYLVGDQIELVLPT